MERYIRDCDVKSKGESSSKMLLVYFYEQRCAKIQDSQEGYIGDALFELVDEFFQKAINLDPSNYRIQYNRYTLYYNSAVLLKKQSRVKGLSSYEVTALQKLSLIHISEPTRPLYISYAVFCLKKPSGP